MFKIKPLLITQSIPGYKVEIIEYAQLEVFLRLEEYFLSVLYLRIYGRIQSCAL